MLQPYMKVSNMANIGYFRSIPTMHIVFTCKTIFKVHGKPLSKNPWMPCLLAAVWLVRNVCSTPRLVKNTNLWLVDFSGIFATKSRHVNFQEKAGIPAFLVKIHAFSFLFMMFWAFLTRFPAFFVKSHSHVCKRVSSLSRHTYAQNSIESLCILILG